MLGGSSKGGDIALVFFFVIERTYCLMFKYFFAPRELASEFAFSFCEWDHHEVSRDFWENKSDSEVIQRFNPFSRTVTGR